MGRTLDTLKQGEWTRTSSPRVETTQPVKTTEGCMLDWTLAQEEVPYIEIGGPGKHFEASPQVLSIVHPPLPTVVKPPHRPTVEKIPAQPREPAIVSASPVVPSLKEPGPMRVAFEPLIAGSASPGPIAVEVLRYHQPEHPISKQYDSLFAKILEGLNGIGAQVLLFSGLRPHIGASTVVLNLAVSSAESGKRRTIVVDANLRRPSAASRLGTIVSTGLEDVLAGSAALEASVLKTVVSSLHLLPSRGKQTEDVLVGEGLSWVIGWLRERYDAILIDGPCLEDAVSVGLLAPLSDGVYGVLPQGELTTPPRGLAQTITRMGGRLRGFLHTHFES